MILYTLIQKLGGNLVYVVLAVAFLFLVLLFLKVKHTKHKASTMLFWVVLFFFIATFMMSIAGKGYDLSTFEGLKGASSNYWKWMLNSVDNMKSITANAVKMDWGF
jgi:hypothetical protein